MRPIKDVVCDLVEQAMEAADQLLDGPEKLKEGVALANLLRANGIEIDYKGVQAWARGASNPPARSLLEAMRLTGVSVDAALHEEPFTSRMDRIEGELGALRKELRERLDARRGAE